MKELACRRERNIPEIFSMYEVSFAKLSEMYFQGTTWPPVQYISGLVDDDSVFCLLYKVRPQTALIAENKDSAYPNRQLGCLFVRAICQKASVQHHANHS